MTAADMHPSTHLYKLTWLPGHMMRVSHAPVHACPRNAGKVDLEKYRIQVLVGGRQRYNNDACSMNVRMRARCLLASVELELGIGHMITTAACEQGP